MIMDQQKTGRFLKELRKEKGLTQEQVAEHFNVAGRTVSRWETGSNMPDLSMLAEISSFYEVDIREIIDGERKSEKMDNELKETLEKVADYNDAIYAKTTRTGIITMIVVFIILVLISAFKEISSAPLVSMLCAYGGATYISKLKYTKDKSNLIVGIMFFAAMLINTIVFILK